MIVARRGSPGEVDRAVTRDGARDVAPMAIGIVRKKSVGGSAVHGQDLAMAVVDRQGARRCDALRYDRVPRIVEDAQAVLQPRVRNGHDLTGAKESMVP